MKLGRMLLGGILALLCLLSGSVSAQVITEFSSGITAGLQPTGIAAGPDGNLWFTELSGGTGKIGRINPTTFVITEYGTGISAGFSPIGIAAGADGNLWFTEYSGTTSKIGQINPTTGVITEYVTGLTFGAVLAGISAGGDGNLWFAGNVGTGGFIGRISPTTHVITQFSNGISASSVPVGIAAGPDGNLWFTEENLLFGGRIGKINPTTGTITEYTSGVQANAEPRGIVAGPDGNLWFTDISGVSGGAIGKVNPATGVTVSTSLPTGPVPIGIAAGADGNLWFTEQSNNQIGKILPATAAATYYSAGISASAVLQQIAAGPDGNLWFTESAGRIGRVALTATPSPPVITKNFLSPTIQAGALSQVGLHFTINNPNVSGTLTGIGFTDTLPAGLVINTPNGLVASCSGVTAPAGGNVISMSGGGVGPGLTCTIDVTINAPAGTSPGLRHNVTSAVTSTEGGTGNTASSDITVQSVSLAAPLFSKQFGTGNIALNGTTSLTFTITNTNLAGLTGLAFSDTFPAGLVVSTPNGASGNCGGTVTAAAGSGIVSLSGGTLAAGTQCTFSVNVTGVTTGIKNNVTGSITATESGAGGTASASVTVAAVSPPGIAKAFGAASIAQNGTTSLTFTVSNPNAATALTGVAFSDTLPAGLVVSTPNVLTGSCGGGAIVAVAGSGTVSLSGATLAANSSCTFSVNVTGTTAGTKNNTTGAVSSVEGGTGLTASAGITVVAITPPTIAKSFGAGSIALNTATSLSFTINNPNAGTGLTGVGFTDTLPAGLVVSTPNGLAGSCGGGTITATAGSGSVILTGATLAGSAACTFSVNVTGTTEGTKNNTTGAVTSVEGGTGSTASASVTVVAVAAPVSVIPTLQQWALWLLGLLILIVTADIISRQRSRD